MAAALKSAPRRDHTAYPSGEMPLVTLRYIAQMNERKFQELAHRRTSTLDDYLALSSQTVG